jgi:hypothetical protein
MARNPADAFRECCPPRPAAPLTRPRQGPAQEGAQKGPCAPRPRCPSSPPRRTRPAAPRPATLPSSKRTPPVGLSPTSPFAFDTQPPTDLEEEIGQLEASSSDNARLADLKAELEKINKKKEEYVTEHPEQRNLVYRKRRRQDPAEAAPEQAPPPKRRVFNKKGLPRHPERSIYYDPVMNPYGVPPPGMPYLERGQYSPLNLNARCKLSFQHCVQTK